jgi:hypothetical protein
MIASSAPQKRTALLTTTSRTGWSSVGEALMILRTSPVAVWLLQGLFGLVEQADVLDRDDRLVGEGLEEIRLPVGEGIYFRAPQLDYAQRSTFPDQRDAQNRPMGVLLGLGELVRLAQEIDDVNGPPFEYRSPPHRPAYDRECELADHFRGGRRGRPVTRAEREAVAVEEEDAALDRPAQASGTLDQSVEHVWMSVGELEITRKISLVAVCCSKASFVSLNKRTFSMAITAWAAKVSRRAICFSENGLTSSRRI